MQFYIVFNIYFTVECMREHFLIYTMTDDDNNTNKNSQKAHFRVRMQLKYRFGSLNFWCILLYTHHTLNHIVSGEYGFSVTLHTHGLCACFFLSITLNSFSLSLIHAIKKKRLFFSVAVVAAAKPK